MKCGLKFMADFAIRVKDHGLRSGETPALYFRTLHYAMNQIIFQPDRFCGCTRHQDQVETAFSPNCDTLGGREHLVRGCPFSRKDLLWLIFRKIPTSICCLA